MLQTLLVKNYAIIEEISLDFNAGFSVITGETGAGKSILLGALSLILGQRADTSILNNKEKKCVVEGVFNVPKELVTDFFLAHQLDLEFPVVIRREIAANGKSRAFINDTPVNLTLLKDLTTVLLDIHSQHETLALNSAEFQINVIDAFAKSNSLLNDYKEKYVSLKQLEQRFYQLKNTENSAKADADYLQFQLNELKALQLKKGEHEVLEQQLEMINNAEQIISTLQLAAEGLQNNDESIVVKLTAIEQAFRKISHCSEDYQQLNERINSVLIELKDIFSEVESQLDSVDVDASEQEVINNRVNTINTLIQKHRLTQADELIDLEQQLEEQLDGINSSEEKLLALGKEIQEKHQVATAAAKKLSAHRLKILSAFEKNIINNLKELGMENAVFKIHHQPLKELNSFGMDEFEFMFSANKGMTPKPLNKTASGGELSRLMLTIKALLAQNSTLQTILFDEIDTGVSGDIAYKMAAIMEGMSNNIQVIAITHLPQVAAKGNTHFKIYKSNKGNKTQTFVNILDNNQRIEEIAKMLSGKELTEAAKENAKNLLIIK
ncbi:MAG TPA: DNA repair protein RecN [Vicingaceae bacterium]|nr:DNA repair protein RecN [Vicingaceae bacterium]